MPVLSIEMILSYLAQILKFIFSTIIHYMDTHASRILYYILQYISIFAV